MFFQTLQYILIPALLGAQILLTIILHKGDICPGQRGRIHKWLPVLILGWCLIAGVGMTYAMVFAINLIPAIAIAGFYFSVKTSKTRDKGPLIIMALANGFAAASFVNLALGSGSFTQLFFALIGPFLFGALLTHLLLTLARTRLQAFHRLLPISGIISGIVMVVILLCQTLSIHEIFLDRMAVKLGIGLGLMLLSLGLWNFHLFNKQAAKWQFLVPASIIMAISGYYQFQLFFVM
ncbi:MULTISPECIES: hypothetical protein [Aliivibrio]|jgi:uncharacterized membrane protein YeaQ/YmgE (transglycosylase-associated protein family)|uniref:Membrane protein n=2 Tax=Aliivibrio TaxID=511678 RepID=B6EHW6_ALISL|nr:MULTISPECIES: hypothetical protein [Aliivibrio]AZL84194.1 hypothetical protein EIJ81_05695 [Aliivibrio salmonicida]MBB1312600.1 hypothetical protein [Aliivibrio sp. SR45-2]OEF16456.1 hypothetical protein A1Q5_06300 [Aliivibrio logei 5S-186]CAQ78543.1 membrane protein [Aliivibrio salmonicida LFI1238]